jgi:hypothetical protein
MGAFPVCLYWLLLPLTVGLYYWVFTEREDERGGYLSGLGALFRLPLAFIILIGAVATIEGLQILCK